MTILDQLAEHARERVRNSKMLMPAEEIRQKALSLLKAIILLRKL